MRSQTLRDLGICNTPLLVFLKLKISLYLIIDILDTYDDMLLIFGHDLGMPDMLYLSVHDKTVSDRI